MPLTNKTISNTYKDVIHVDNANSGIDSTLRELMSGNGNKSALSVSTNNTRIKPASNSATTLDIQKQDGTEMVLVDTTNTLVKVLGQFVNVQTRDFHLKSADALPSGTSWTPLTLSAMRLQASFTMGTGTDPNTSQTISTNADDMVNSNWYVPFNITVDNVYVWWGADAVSGDSVEFSIMAYDIDTTNTATGGDLTNGFEVADNTARAGAGYEQSYFENLSIKTADVDSGKSIMAFVKQNGTNSDLSVFVQIVYHLRSV